MSLELPGDIEPFITDDYSQIRSSAVYVLELSKPDDVRAAWFDEYDHPPEYLEELAEARRVLYVGGAKDLLKRLTVHKDSNKQKPALMEVCDIAALWDVTWFQSSERAFERESGIATALANDVPDTFVHQR